MTTLDTTGTTKENVTSESTGSAASVTTKLDESEPDTTKFDEYAAILDNVFKLIADCENGQSLKNLLDGPICHAGFKRLN